MAVIIGVKILKWPDNELSFSRVYPVIRRNRWTTVRSPSTHLTSIIPWQWVSTRTAPVRKRSRFWTPRMLTSSVRTHRALNVISLISRYRHKRKHHNMTRRAPKSLVYRLALGKVTVFLQVLMWRLSRWTTIISQTRCRRLRPPWVSFSSRRKMRRAISMQKNCRIMRASIAASTSRIVLLCATAVKSGFVMAEATPLAVTLSIT